MIKKILLILNSLFILGCFAEETVTFNERTIYGEKSNIDFSSSSLEKDLNKAWLYFFDQHGSDIKSQKQPVYAVYLPNEGYQTSIIIGLDQPLSRTKDTNKTTIPSREYIHWNIKKPTEQKIAQMWDQIIAEYPVDAQTLIFERYTFGMTGNIHTADIYISINKE